MRFLFIIFLVLVLFSCESNWGKYGGYRMDYESEMQYYLVLDKVDTVLEDYPYSNKGTFVKYYHNNGIVDTVFISNGGTVIESFVDDKAISFNDQFIILKQKPLQDICECNVACLTKKYPDNDSLPLYEMCKDALNKSTFYQYWIVDKIEDAVYGPFQKEKYLLKRKELGVSDSLQLKE